MQATGVLYQSLIQQIYQISWPSRTTRDKAIAFVQSLIRKRHMENTDPLEFTDMAKNYFTKKIGIHYRKVIKPLLDHNIIESSKYYRPGYYNEQEEYIKGQCLSYRINPELLDDEVIKVIYKGEKKKQNCHDEVTMRSKQIMRQIRIADLDSRQIIEFVKKSLTDERIRKMIRVNTEIREQVVKLKVPSESGAYYKHVKVSELNLLSKSLIKDGKHYVIEHLDTYIKRKRRHLTQAYCDQLLRIKHRNVYADRNETNLRLDSNLTNLKGEFMGMLSIDDQRLSQVDLKNSQFRLFVYLLEQAERISLYQQGNHEEKKAEFYSAKTAKADNQVKISKEGYIDGKPVTLLWITFDKMCVLKSGAMRSISSDYKEFKRLVKTGQLYEYIQRIVFTETGRTIDRKEAKRIMFTIAFSAYRYQPEEKQIVKKYFPTIIAMIDEYKKCMIELYAQMGDAAHQQKGNASFAILLQQTESLIFIDRILAKCHKRKIKALSKHDSIVCRQSDKHKVTKIICRVLNGLLGKASYSLDIDGEVFQLRSKRKSRIMRVATDYVNTLFGLESNRANAPPKSIHSTPSAILNTSPALPSRGRIRNQRIEAMRKKIMGV